MSTIAQPKEPLGLESLAKKQCLNEQEFRKEVFHEPAKSKKLPYGLQNLHKLDLVQSVKQENMADSCFEKLRLHVRSSQQ